ncbi:hypothetical protein NOM01_10965 [Sporolactobacillus sp. STSJ-5]|uniref:hypothetical protein n=1 Tax=Sporolactobacillus sp. STSJ-5 TaxID=2965076 RepID=UPI002104954A|nr:hypothetical protein [Sporolactobacillus sp. STSJ-5]MCQ2010536.1 hypothetical protein [Sporolactobacillus sp. STSJ-5]
MGSVNAPYRTIGVTLNRDFRNNQNANLVDIGNDVLMIYNMIQSIVAQGDSSPQAAAAQVGQDGTAYASLKARLDAEFLKLRGRFTATAAEPSSPIAGDIWYKEMS